MGLAPRPGRVGYARRPACHTRHPHHFHFFLLLLPRQTSVHFLLIVLLLGLGFGLVLLLLRHPPRRRPRRGLLPLPHLRLLRRLDCSWGGARGGEGQRGPTPPPPTPPLSLSDPLLVPSPDLSSPAVFETRSS